MGNGHPSIPEETRKEKKEKETRISRLSLSSLPSFITSAFPLRKIIILIKNIEKERRLSNFKLGRENLRRAAPARPSSPSSNSVVIEPHQVRARFTFDPTKLFAIFDSPCVYVSEASRGFALWSCFRSRDGTGSFFA